MKRALLIALAATLILASIAFAQPATWQQLDLDPGQTFSVACPDAIMLLHIETHELIGHCGAGGTVPPDHTIFNSPLAPESPPPSILSIPSTPSTNLFLPGIAQ